MRACVCVCVCVWGEGEGLFVVEVLLSVIASSFFFFFFSFLFLTNLPLVTNTMTLNTTNELKNHCGKIKYEELYKPLLSKISQATTELKLSKTKIKAKVHLQEREIEGRREQEGESYKLHKVNEETRRQNGFII